MSTNSHYVVQKSKSMKKAESNPNKGFKYRKWLEDVMSSEKGPDDAVTDEYVDTQGNDVDIVAVGDSSTMKVDENGNEYEEKICPTTKVRYLTYRSKRGQW